MRQAVRFYLGMYRWSSFLVYDKRAGRLMGAVISKEEFGMVSPNVCFNLILRLTMKSKKRKAVKWRKFQEKIRDNSKYFIHLFFVQKTIVSSKVILALIKTRWNNHCVAQTLGGVLKVSFLFQIVMRDLVHQLYRQCILRQGVAGPPCLPPAQQCLICTERLAARWDTSCCGRGSGRRVFGERVRRMGRVKGHRARHKPTAIDL